LLLAVLIMAAFPDVLSGANTFFIRDFALFGYPLAQYHRDCFWHGSLPLWDPYNDCGIPFLAQWNTMVLYPFSLFYVALPLSWSLGIFCLAHLFWAGFGMYFLIAKWTENRVAASVAGVAFAFSGLGLNCVMWPNDIAALAWAPWVIWAAERAAVKGGRALYIAVILGALQMLTGGPEVILLTWALLMLLVLGGRKASSIARCFLVAGLVAALCAVQLLPFLDLLRHSHRDALPNSASWAMPAWGWANLIVPLFRMRPAYFGVYAQPGQHWTSSYYLGIATLALVAWAALSLRNWRGYALMLAAVFGAVLAFGNRGYLYPIIKTLIPQIGALRYPIKSIVLTTLAVPMLAGLAVARLSAPAAGRQEFRRLFAIVLALALAALGVLGWAWSDHMTAQDWSVLWRNAAMRLVVLATLGALVLVICNKPQSAVTTWVWASLPILLWADGITHMPRQNPTAPRWVYDAGLVDDALPRDPRPALGQSRAMVSPQADYELAFSHIPDPAKHQLSRRACLFNNLNLLDRVPKVNGIFSLYPKHEAEVLTLIYGDTNSYPVALADFLAVSQVSAPGDVFSWARRATALPLITGGQKPVFAAANETLSGLASPRFDPRAVVYLPEQDKAQVCDARPDAIQIQPEEFSAQRVDLRTSSTAGGLVVIAQTFYHWWQCYLDGKPVPLLRANHAFQAVLVPAGNHQIQLRYEDKAFTIGAVISSVTLLACALGWSYARRATFDRSPA
jgi:hypothetical protein